jgi:2'-5' RNA ligase
MESRLPSPRNSPTQRLFWGVSLTAELGSRIGSWQRHAASLLPGARWTPPENLHLTLAFLGGRPSTELEAIVAAAGGIAGATPAFELRTAGLGGFPSLRRARILWLGFESTSALERLASLLRNAMEPFGCRRDEGPITPHLTLARFKSPAPLPTLPDPDAAALDVREIHLFERVSRAEGPRYLRRATLALSASMPPAPGSVPPASRAW